MSSSPPLPCISRRSLAPCLPPHGQCERLTSRLESPAGSPAAAVERAAVGKAYVAPDKLLKLSHPPHPPTPDRGASGAATCCLIADLILHSSLRAESTAPFMASFCHSLTGTKQLYRPFKNPPSHRPAHLSYVTIPVSSKLLKSALDRNQTSRKSRKKSIKQDLLMERKPFPNSPIVLGLLGVGSESVLRNERAFSGCGFVLSPAVSSIQPFQCTLNIKCRGETVETQH